MRNCLRKSVEATLNFSRSFFKKICLDGLLDAAELL